MIQAFENTLRQRVTYQKRIQIQKSLLKKISGFLTLSLAAITAYAHYPGLALAPASKEIDYKSLVFNGEYAAYYQGNDIVVIKADSFDPKHTLINSPSSRQRISKLFLCGSTLVSLTDKNLITYDLSDNISEKNFSQRLLKTKHPFDTSNPLLEIWDDYILGLNHDLNALVGIRFRNFDKSNEDKFKIPFENSEQTQIKKLAIHRDLAYLLGSKVITIALRNKSERDSLPQLKEFNKELNLNENLKNLNKNLKKSPLQWISSCITYPINCLYYALKTNHQVELRAASLVNYAENPFDPPVKLHPSCSLLYSDDQGFSVLGENNSLYVAIPSTNRVSKPIFLKEGPLEHPATQENHCATYHDGYLYLFLNTEKHSTYVLKLDESNASPVCFHPEDYHTVHLVRSKDKIVRILDIGEGTYLPCLSPVYPDPSLIPKFFTKSKAECHTTSDRALLNATLSEFQFSKNFDYYMLYLSQPNLTDNPYLHLKDRLNPLTSISQQQPNNTSTESKKDLSLKIQTTKFRKKAAAMLKNEISKDLSLGIQTDNFAKNIRNPMEAIKNSTSLKETTIHSGDFSSFCQTEEGKNLLQFFDQQQANSIEKIVNEYNQGITISRVLLTLLAQSAIQDKPSKTIDLLTSMRKHDPNYLLFQAIADRIIKKEKIDSRYFYTKVSFKANTMDFDTNFSKVYPEKTEVKPDIQAFKDLEIVLIGLRTK